MQLVLLDPGGKGGPEFWSRSEERGFLPASSNEKRDKEGKNHLVSGA